MKKVNEKYFLNQVGVLMVRLFYTQITRNMRKHSIFISHLVILLMLGGCQHETDEIKLPLPEQAFSTSSEIAGLIKYITLRDGSRDNILDSASCVSLVFPLRVNVNGQEIIVNSEDDLKYVERIVDESGSDDDDIKLLFPVTVELADYTTLTIPSEDALEDLMDQCKEGGFDDDIECIDFVYPVKLAIYSTRNEVSEVVEITSDQSLFDFIEAMEDDELVSFVFPIIMKSFDGLEIAVENNEELRIVIQNVGDDCDEDDDLDFDDDNVETSGLTTTLLDRTWKIDYFFDESVQTEQFSSYVFTFNTDGSATVTDGISSITGSWEIYGNDGRLEVQFDFEGNLPVVEINGEWVVEDFSDTMLTLKDDSEDEPVKALILKKQ